MEEASRISAVRGEVRRLLSRSSAFQALPSEQRRQLANDMVRVGAYLAEPSNAEGLASSLAAMPVASSLAASAPADSAPVASALDDAADKLKNRLAEAPKQVGADFQASAMKQGVQEFGELVKTVDFPQFVSGLVHGVFQAVVDASIQQMQAYGELLQAVSKSVDQFANDHISEGQARDYIANAHPSEITVDTSGDTAKLKMREDAPGIVNLGQEFNVGRSVDLDDPTSELALVNAAKLQMGKQRQQMMATMVLMGINRIVVTNGKINAKVIFDINASDEAKRRAKAEYHDQSSQQFGADARVSAMGGLWGSAGTSASTSHKTSVTSAVDDTSESKATMKAQLSGEVSLNFKSDVFPLEKLVDAGGVQMLNDRAAPAPLPNTAAPAAPRPAPAPAPAPATGGQR